MIRAGYPPTVPQAIIGHAAITTALDLHGHLYPGDMDQYADRLDDAANGATGTGTAPVAVSVGVKKAKTGPDDKEDDPGES